MPRKYVRKPKRVTRRGKKFSKVSFVRAKPLTLAVSSSAALQSGQVAVLRTEQIELLGLANSYLITLPAGLSIFPEVFGVYITRVDGYFSGFNAIDVGNQYASYAYLHNISPGVFQIGREEYHIDSMSTVDPTDTLRVEVLSTSVLPTAAGYFFFRGMIVEDET